MCDPDSTGASITVVVKFLSALRLRAGVGVENLVLPNGSTLGKVAEHLEQRYGLQLPSSQVMAMLNSRGWQQAAQGLDTPLHDGDVIHLFPPISGG